MYKANKIGLINFWWYDDEEFDFGDGKLLLRGQNGSGKSVTLQSFIPLILDGNKSPKRLDTFGSTDKHIEYYLLGENEKDEAIGYLYMEFYDNTKEKYITIGMGLHAKRGKQTTFYGFALKDGRRINKDFFLYKNNDGLHKVPLTKQELRSALGINNILVETTKEYKAMVNDLLFGFPSIESYDEYINLILQIRSPKLSKEYNPTKLMEILNEVLPPLTEEELSPLTQTLENMAQTREKMDTLSSQIKSISNFLIMFDNYNNTILYKKIENYLNELKKETNLKEQYKDLEKTLNTKKENLNKLTEEFSKKTSEYQQAKTELENINNKDLKDLSKKSLDLESNINEIKDNINKNKQRLEETKQKISQKDHDLKNKDNEKSILEREYNSKIKDCLDYASEINFNSFKETIASLEIDSINYPYLEKMLDDKSKEIKSCLKELERREKIIQEQNNYIEEYETLKNDILSKEGNIKELNNELDNELDILTNKIYLLNQNNKELKLDDDTYKVIINTLDEYSKSNYDTAKKIYKNTADSLKSTYQTEINNHKLKKSQEQSILDNLNKEYETLSNTKELLIFEDDLQTKSTHILQEQNIDSIYFYQAIDFKDNIPLAKQNELEETLYYSKILGSRLFKEKDLSKISDLNINYLTPSTKKENNLTKYFKPCSNEIISNEYIIKILESISLDEKDKVSITKTGFNFDFLHGSISKEYETKYIGALTRKKQLEKKLNQLKDTIEEENSKIKSLDNLIFQINHKINVIDEELELFPDDNELNKLLNNIEKINIEINYLRTQQLKKEELIRNLKKAEEEIILLLNNYSSDIPKNLPNYTNALEVISNLKNEFTKLNSITTSLNTINEFIISLNNTLEDLKQDENEIYGDISKENNKLTKYENEYFAIQKILNTKEYQDLISKINTLNLIVDNYDKESQTISKQLGILSAEITNFKEETIKLNENLAKEKYLVEINKEILDEELELKYVNIQSNSLDDIKNWYKTAKINSKYDNLEGNYYSAYNDYRQELADYNLKDTTLFEDRRALIEKYTSLNIPKETLEQIYASAKRHDITTIYQGQKLDIYTLKKYLVTAHEDNKLYLDDQDKHLFEDILLRTIGGKIKNRIISAQEWVKNTNQIMQEHQENSNLSFYLEWKPKSKEALDEMDTRELVELFMKPSATLKDDRLVRHFRSKITRAEELMGDNKESYFQVVASILDYRNWFEFKLYFKKDTEDKKELTNKKFSVFSGGEKAKTMYVPLFASMYSKLTNAVPYAPRLIAMDEAFAGVDDQNIEEMFNILNSFNLDYILTSQIIWCTYSCIKELSICELVSSKSTKSIAVKRYRWNGHVKEVVIK